MTETDLRTAIIEELCDLAPMPSVVPGVLAEGRRRERRRRRATVALAAAAVAGIVAVTTTLPGILSEDAHAPAEPAVTDGKREFLGWAADKLADALPERVGEVELLKRGDDADLVTYVDGMRIEIGLTLFPVDTPRSYAEGDTYVPFTCTGDSACTEAPNLDAIVSRDNGPFSASGAVPFAGLTVDLTDVTDTVDGAGLGLYGERPPAGPLPLTDQELFDLAASPEFESLWREFAKHPEWIDPIGAPRYAAPDDHPFSDFGDDSGE